MRLGIDTGGTYTDAVLLAEGDGVLATAKALTTPHDLFLGIAAAVRAVLQGQPTETVRAIGLVGLSTTLATNALVEGRGGRAGLVLIGMGPESLGRGGLGAVLEGAPVACIAGGHDAFGRERCPVDMAALDQALETLGKGVDGLAVTAAFAVRNPAHEHAAAARITALTGLPVTLSSELTSRLDAPKRALTTFLNARLIPAIAGLIVAVERLLAEQGITAPLLVVRGDGALMAASIARQRPVETILSGPAASVVGAAHLSGQRRAVVSDVGGTTTDIAILEDGRPRLAALGARVGGHRTMVEAIDLSTTGLGGDSEVGRNAESRLTLGPRRVVPLSLLAHEHPAVLDVLAREVERGVPRATDARFALRLIDGREPDGLSRSQQRLLAILESGPLPLETVVDREHLAIPLDALVRRGLVAIAGFTPSDAAHVLGLQAGWSSEAARRAAWLEARKAGSDDGAEGFARAVLELARTQSAEALVEAAWEASGGAPATLGPLARDPLFARALASTRPGSGPGSGPAEARQPLSLAFRLDRPVVAVGGPAAIFYAGVPERLGSTLVIPDHHQVCNAIGAVVGDVVRHVERVATRISEERLALYLGEAIVEEADPAVARARLEADARAAAVAAALAAGAVDPVVTIRVEEDRATLDSGPDIVVEIRVRATASGRPRQTR
jgi:N-methylhydantoinase A/oxoprolinase/acetone carboxylase beta subunit